MHKFRTLLIAATAAAGLVATGASAASLDSLVIHGAPAKKFWRNTPSPSTLRRKSPPPASITPNNTMLPFPLPSWIRSAR